jgi:hypothetical protein
VTRARLTAGAVIGVLLAVAVTVWSGCAAYAQQGQPTADPSVTWAQLGTALGAILSAAAAAGGSGYVAARRSVGAGGLSEEQAAALAKIATASAVLDERTREIRREQRRARKTLVKHGKALAVLLADPPAGSAGRTIVPLGLDDDEEEADEDDDDVDSDEPGRSG